MSAGWTTHNGGPNPAPGRAVRVRFRDGGTNEGPSSAFLGWYHEPLNGNPALRQEDIVGYAVIQPAGAGVVARGYRKTEKWHAARERKMASLRASKADFLKSPERLAKEAARRQAALFAPSQPGTDAREAGGSEPPSTHRRETP